MVNLIKTGEQQILAHISNLYKTSGRLFTMSIERDAAGSYISADMLTSQAVRLDQRAAYLEDILDAADGNSVWAHA